MIVGEQTQTDNTKRIAKNTILLYVRMLLMMGISFFTTREVLRILGVVDFGIYNVVAGIVVLFVFLNNAMVTSTQRYLNFEIGKSSSTLQINKIFSSCLTIHIGIAIVVWFVAEVIGVWFVNNYLDIPDGRMEAANIVYQCSILGAVINIFRTPFNAVIVSYEKMNVYAYMGIIETLMKLGVVYLLFAFRFDALVLYSLLMLLVVFLTTVLYVVYCRKQFEICHSYTLYRDKRLYGHLLSFSGWSLLGSMANLGATQGMGILLNIFFGVTVNAAMGVAQQAATAMYNFVTNFQTAFNPQLVKLYASGQSTAFENLVLRTSKYSFYLLWVISLPILLCCHTCLSLWLGSVPDHAEQFCVLLLVFSLIDALQGPLWTSVQATGNIKFYQIMISILVLSNLPVSYIFLKNGYSAESVFVIRVLINVLAAIARVSYLRIKLGFLVSRYVREVCIPCCIVVIISFFITTFVHELLQGYIQLLVTTCVSLFVNIVSVYFVGMMKQERSFINGLLISKLTRS